MSDRGGSARAAGLLAGLALAVGLAGCAQETVPSDHFYRLAIGALHGPARGRIESTVLVPSFVAEGLLSERAIVWSSSEHPERLERYHYDFWALPPARMFQELTVEALRSGGVARRVVTPDLRVDAPWTLRGRVTRLEQVLGAKPHVVLALEFALEHHGELVWMHAYRTERPAGDGSVTAAASAMSAAAAEVYARVLDDLPR